MLSTVQQHYPSAVNSRDFILNTFRAIHDRLQLSPSQLLLAHSICSDDVNSIEYPEEGRAMLGPFNLGGLDGYPFAGLTGMAAFAGHVPDDGAHHVRVGDDEQAEQAAAHGADREEPGFGADRAAQHAEAAAEHVAAGPRGQDPPP